VYQRRHLTTNDNESTPNRLLNSPVYRCKILDKPQSREYYNEKYAKGVAFMEVTLDANAVIALANDEPDAVYLKVLRDDYHQRGLITLSVGRSTLLERIPKGATDPPHVIAEKRIADAGLNIDRVALYRSGPSQLFYCRGCNAYVYGVGLERSYAQLIHDVITGEKNIDFSYYQYRERRKNDPVEVVQKRWHNQKNDTLGLFEHVKWGGDIFVTNDKGILSKRDKFASIVPGRILTPKETLEELDKMTLPLPQNPAGQIRLEVQHCEICRLKQQTAR